MRRRSEGPTRRRERSGISCRTGVSGLRALSSAHWFPAEPGRLRLHGELGSRSPDSVRLQLRGVNQFLDIFIADIQRLDADGRRRLKTGTIAGGLVALGLAVIVTWYEAGIPDDPGVIFLALGSSASPEPGSELWSGEPP